MRRLIKLKDNPTLFIWLFLLFISSILALISAYGHYKLQKEIFTDLTFFHYLLGME